MWVCVCVYINVCFCVCVCVCLRESEREIERDCVLACRPGSFYIIAYRSKKTWIKLGQFIVDPSVGVPVCVCVCVRARVCVCCCLHVCVCVYVCMFAVNFPMVQCYIKCICLFSSTLRSNEWHLCVYVVVCECVCVCVCVNNNTNITFVPSLLLLFLCIGGEQQISTVEGFLPLKVLSLHTHTHTHTHMFRHRWACRYSRPNIVYPYIQLCKDHLVLVGVCVHKLRLRSHIQSI